MLAADTPSSSPNFCRVSPRRCRSFRMSAADTTVHFACALMTSPLRQKKRSGLLRSQVRLLSESLCRFRGRHQYGLDDLSARHLVSMLAILHREPGEILRLQAMTHDPLLCEWNAVTPRDLRRDKHA